MKAMPQATYDRPTTFDEACRACELLASYFGPYLAPSLEGAALSTQRGFRELVTPLFGSPESELRRKVKQSLRAVKLNRAGKADESVGEQFARLHQILYKFGKGE